MQNLIRVVAWMAPVLLLLLVIIIQRLDKNDAEMAVDIANFDLEFSVQQADLTRNKLFWIKQQKAAEKRIKIADNELYRAKGKVTKHTDIMEKTIKEQPNEASK